MTPPGASAAAPNCANSRLRRRSSRIAVGALSSTTSWKRGVAALPQLLIEPDSTQASPPVAAVSSGGRAARSRSVWNGGSVGSQIRSSDSICGMPSRPASARPKVLVPAPQAPVT